MKYPRFPFWHIAIIVIWAISVCFRALIVWTMLFLDKPFALSDFAWTAWCVAGLVWSVLCFDRYTFKREHLLAEQRMARAQLGLEAVACVMHDRIRRGYLIPGTPLHASALRHKRRALDAWRLAVSFRKRRDGIA